MAPRLLLLLCAAAVCALCAAGPAEAYRGPHSKARLHHGRRSGRGAVAQERVLLDSGAAAAAAPGGPRERAAELVLPPGASLPARAYAERTTLCVTSGCIALVGGRQGPPEAEPLCARAAGGVGAEAGVGGAPPVAAPAVPACAALGGPGAAAVSLANVGRGTAIALEFVSSPAAVDLSRRR